MEMRIDPGEAWERLRASRSSRPGRADLKKNPRRGRTYSTALEQAEQMFRAAQAVGAQTRPLLIFYGLSQAGRAIAAAATSLEKEDWNLVSHGIRASELEKDFPNITFRTGPLGNAGSFVRLSELLASPVWGNGTAVKLEEIWNAIPGNEGYPLSTGDRFMPLLAERNFGDRSGLTISMIPPDSVMEGGSQASVDAFVAPYARVAGFIGWTKKERIADGWGQKLGWWLNLRWAVSGAPAESTKAESTQLDGMAFEDFLEDIRRLSEEEKQELRAYLSRPRGPTRAERENALFDIIVRKYAQRSYIFPAPAGLSGALHPLMAWWAVLYALSMLARYQPAQWAGHINIDESPHAVPIEKLLERAMEHLPVLIADTIDDVGTWT